MKQTKLKVHLTRRMCMPNCIIGLGGKRNHFIKHCPEDGNKIPMIRPEYTAPKSGTFHIKVVQGQVIY
eukprot:3112188-Ditylum_brightwellii.AAC.1